jgi:hypothetical protein
MLVPMAKSPLPAVWMVVGRPSGGKRFVRIAGCEMA